MDTQVVDFRGITNDVDFLGRPGLTDWNALLLQIAPRTYMVRLVESMIERNEERTWFYKRIVGSRKASKAFDKALHDMDWFVNISHT